MVLFEGPNGSGKTTIAQAIACALEPPRSFPGDASALRPPLEELSRRVRSRKGPNARTTIEDRGEALIVNDPAPWTKWFPAEGSRTSAARLISELARAALGVEHDVVRWAAFAYRGHQQTPIINTKGPSEIEPSPLKGALGFGDRGVASEFLGQLLANLENERTKALTYARERGDESRRIEFSQVAVSRQEAIRRFESVFSKILGRQTRIEFSIDRQSPSILFDGEPIPLELLGEGFRSTMAWLSDLLVRLERIHWTDTTRSPIDQDFWLILDEIDESLHPTMQARILPALRELFPNARIYATTHSPFVVASAAEGVVFPIRPDKDHRVRGKVEPRQLEPGQSLEWVVTEIFQAQAGFVDQKSRDLLDEHKRDIRRYERTGNMDWEAFFARRAELMALNDEVRTVVAMQEVPVRLEVDRRMLARVQAREQGAGA